jgi:transcriptional regulator with XRE-family HTH domain
METPLRAYREREDITQQQLAELLGVSKAAVSRWESGARKINEHLLSTVERVTGIPARKLRPDLAQLLSNGQTRQS